MGPRLTGLISVLGLGLVTTVLIKYLNYSTNPLWATAHRASGGWNGTGLVLAALALHEYAHRPVSLFPAPPTSEHKDKPIPPVVSTKLQRILVPIGLGSLIHMIQTFITDAGTIIAWTWTGYPVKGPTLHPFAGEVIAAAALSLILPVRSLGTAWSGFGAGGAYLLYRYPDWIGFYGGLILVIYLLSTFPAFVLIASALPPAQTLGGALVVNIVLDVASVITAAYAFVPMGWILRERTDLVVGFCMLSIVAAAMVSTSIDLPGPERMQARSKLRIAQTTRWTLYASVVMSILGLAASYGKIPSAQPVPYYIDHRIFTGGIWTVSRGMSALTIGALWCRRARS